MGGEMKSGYVLKQLSFIRKVRDRKREENDHDHA
jgi:hypothetical protein